MMAIFPHLPKPCVIPAFLIYGFFFMASYPMIEAALMESVHDSVRGRVFGIFIMIGGTLGNLAHWAVGSWVRNLGGAGATPAGFYGIYFTLALLVLLCSIQPFLSVHFDVDGIVPQEHVSVRSFDATAHFQPDEDSDIPMALEVTLFVPATASVVSPLMLMSGIAALVSLILLATPLIVQVAQCVHALREVPAFRVLPASGAPPPTAIWRSRPPETAPPL